MSTQLELVKTEITKRRPQFDEMNLNKVSFSKELEWAMQAFQANDYLLKMEPNSIYNCLVNVALSGMTLNPLAKQAYLVPRKGKLCVDPSYQGLIKVVTDTGSVTSIKAKPVYEGEPFEIEQGTNGYVKHSISKTGKIGKRIGAYSIAVLNDGSNHIEWMYEAELMAIKARSEAVKSGKISPWSTDESEMIRKTVIKRHWKYLPKSERAQMAAQAIAFDDDINGIDFKSEANPHAAPTIDVEHEEVDQELEIRMQEKIKIIYDILDDSENMPIKVFDGSMLCAVMKVVVEKQIAEGKFNEERADKVIEKLRQEKEEFLKQREAKSSEEAGEPEEAEESDDEGDI